jgi:hypothetical protein
MVSPRWEKLTSTPKPPVSAPAAKLRHVPSMVMLHDAVEHNGPSEDSVERLDGQKSPGT